MVRTTVTDNSLRPFIGWDGEGHRVFVCHSDGTVVNTHHYMLFGCSEGEFITGISLSTRECLDLILYVGEQYPLAHHVGFSFEYDVNMILKDLEWRYLAVLTDIGQVKWQGFRIKHIPHKMLMISKDGITVTIYDTFGFFHCSYIKALDKYCVGDPSQRARISAGKDKRYQFTYSQLKEVKAYWWEEISLFPPLMDKMREACYGAGFFIKEWHGPGALAAYTLKKYHARNWHGKRVPIPVQIARRFAYAGGRFQSWRCGLYFGIVYTADINSAYAYACSHLPRMDTGKWEYRKCPTISAPSDIAHFALYRIRFDASEVERTARENCLPFPLFHRDKKGTLTWPAKTEGWYWSPEAATVAGSKYATFLECWEFKDDGTRPFSFVRDAFETRLRLQAANDPAEKAYKWFLASIYGAFARRVGWNKHTRMPPGSHQLEWAGYITSYCRAFVYRAAMDAAKRGGLISVDTDGVTSTVPFNSDRLPNGVGNGLGEWKLEDFNAVLYWQNGIYWLLGDDGEWKEPKTRGIPKGHLDIRRALDSFHAYTPGFDERNPAISLVRSRFIGYRQGLQHQYDMWRQWVPETVDIEFGGNGKGRHVPSLCRLCLSERSSVRNSSNNLHTITHFPPDHLDSKPHKLPWLEPEPKPEENVMEMGIWSNE
jgi:DNA polymerase family B